MAVKASYPIKITYKISHTSLSSIMYKQSYF